MSGLSILFRRGTAQLLLGLLFAALAVAAVLLLVFLDGYRDAHREAERADRRIAAMSDLRTALLDAETGQRGYLLTTNRAYLDDFTHGAGVLEAALENALDPALKRSPAATGSDDDIRRLAAAKIAELRETIALQAGGRSDAALALVNTDRGKTDMDRLRDLIGSSIDAETQNSAAAHAAADTAGLWIALTLASLAGGVVMMLLWLLSGISRAQRTEAAERIARDEAMARIAAEGRTEKAELAHERMETLAHELDHRMKNIFAVMSSVIRQSTRGAGAEVRDYGEALDGRLHSISTAYSMTKALGEARSMSKHEIIRRVVQSQIGDTHDFAYDGEDFEVQETAVTPLAMILHELTTNSLKYGAWRDRDAPPSVAGNDNAGMDTAGMDAAGVDTAGMDVTVPQAVEGVVLSWSMLPDGRIRMIWREQTGVRQLAGLGTAESGFGSRLLEMCARQMGGAIRYEWLEDGLLCITLGAPQLKLTA